MSRPILTAADARRRSAGDRDGHAETALMERAGAALAEAVRLYAGPRETLILCGPGNNGGDGYVAARHLAAHGYPVRVAALAEPSAEAARWARGQWDGPSSSSPKPQPAPIVIDCLFGTGLSRASRPLFRNGFLSWSIRALVAVACDLPSGVATDDGAMLSPVASL